MGRHTRGRHRGPSVDPRIVLRAAAVTAAVLTLIAALVPTRAREALLGTGNSSADARTSLTLVPPPTAAATGTPASATSKPAAAPTTSSAPVPTTTARPTPKVLAVTEGAPPANGPFGERVVAGARLFIGVPYLWGGVTRAGLDCSGLVLLVLRALGKNPPRTADQQMRWTTRISQADARPGDLVFGVRTNGTAQHVGIYLGNGRMIDAPNAGSTVGEHALYRWPKTVFGRIP